MSLGTPKDLKILKPFGLFFRTQPLLGVCRVFFALNSVLLKKLPSRQVPLIYILVTYPKMYMTVLKRFKALLVDDDEVTNYLNESILVTSAHFMSPLLFSDALFALDFIQKICSGKSNQPLPNLFLVDINMPNLDGFEFVEQLQEMHPNIMDEAVVCFLTTSNHAKDYRRAKALGIDYYIEKPLKMKDIKRIITQLNKRLKSLLS